MRKKIYKIIILIILILFSILVSSLVKHRVFDGGSEQSYAKPGLITVVFGKEAINLTVGLGDSFYEALMQAKSNGKLTISGKSYPVLGFFVTDIGSLHQGGGKHLFYYINGKEAQVGVSSYFPKNGDSILWKLK